MAITILKGTIVSAPALGKLDITENGYLVAEDGKITVYFSEGEFTGDDIEKDYFGCAGVAHISGLQDKLIRLARGGFKHHTTVANGQLKAVLEEALGTYLGYDVISIEG